MIKTIEINRSQLSACVGVLSGEKGSDQFKNTVLSYINGDIPVWISTNLTQSQWDKFCNGKLPHKELIKAQVVL